MKQKVKMKAIHQTVKGQTPTGASTLSPVDEVSDLAVEHVRPLWWLDSDESDAESDASDEWDKTNQVKPLPASLID